MVRFVGRAWRWIPRARNTHQALVSSSCDLPSPQWGGASNFAAYHKMGHNLGIDTHPSSAVALHKLNCMKYTINVKYTLRIT